jgi:hypothetical protein
VSRGISTVGVVVGWLGMYQTGMEVESVAQLVRKGGRKNRRGVLSKGEHPASTVYSTCVEEKFESEMH